MRHFKLQDGRELSQRQAGGLRVDSFGDKFVVEAYEHATGNWVALKDGTFSTRDQAQHIISDHQALERERMFEVPDKSNTVGNIDDTQLVMRRAQREQEQELRAGNNLVVNTNADSPQASSVNDVMPPAHQVSRDD